MTYLLVASAALGAILLFLLAAASANTSIFASHYPLLLILNAVVAAALLGLVGYQLVTLRRALKGRVFGSRLTFRLLVLFAVLAVVPGALVYTVSVQFLTKSIESWFDVRVDTALEGALSLGRSALDNMLGDLRGKGRVMALELSDLPPGQHAKALDRMREQAGVDEAMIVAGSGAILASASASREPTRLLPDAPPATALRQARASRDYAAIEPVGEKSLRLRVIVPLGGTTIAEETRLLQLVHAVPPSLAETAETVQSVYRDYRELSLLRAGLKRIYLLTLTLTLLLALFSAIALAFILSRRLSEPLAELAEVHASRWRAGDFSRRPKVTSRDEFGVLTRSFNSMIATARRRARRRRGEPRAARERQGLPREHSRQPIRWRAHVRCCVPAEGREHGRGGDPGRVPPPPAPADRSPARRRSTPSRRRSATALPRDRPTRRGRGSSISPRRRARTLLLRGTRLPGGVRLRRRVRRHHPPHPGAARRRVGGSRAAPRARDQESAHADPALRRADADKLARQARRPRSARCSARHRDHRQPRRGAEGHGRRLPPVRPHARA